MKPLWIFSSIAPSLLCAISATAQQNWDTLLGTPRLAYPQHASQVVGTVQSPQRPSPPAGSRQRTSFRGFMADDATFEVALPYHWEKAGQATFDGAAFQSRRGESFSVGFPTVFANTAVLRANLEAYQFILPPEKVVLLSRLLSAPLDPSAVLTRLFPQVANGAIRGTRILESQRIPSPSADIAFLHYQYLLLPQQDGAFASLLPRALLSQSQVPMEGVAMIMTFPTGLTQAPVTWSFLMTSIEAPQTVFAMEKFDYIRILQSLRFIPKGLAVKVRNNALAQQLVNGMNQTTREVAHLWWLRLGGLAEFGPNDYSPGGTMPDTPGDGMPWWHCAGDQYPFPAPNAPPGRSCENVPVPH